MILKYIHLLDFIILKTVCLFFKIAHKNLYVSFSFVFKDWFPQTNSMFLHNYNIASVVWMYILKIY